MISVQNALISVSDKSKVVELAEALQKMGVNILATGGTAAAIEKAGIKVKKVSKYTGYMELLGGRVKTLHPKIFAGILARRDKEEHLDELKSKDILPIDLIVVNLYPFESQVTRDTPNTEAMEFMDIGGETLIRSAAKNWSSVGVVVDPSDYSLIIEELEQNGGISAEGSKKLAEKAMWLTVRYNSNIYKYLSSDKLPQYLSLTYPKLFDLRYGENPHQKACFYSDEPIDKLHGKELSYNNILDMGAAWQMASSFTEPACAVIKHTNPCGLATDSDINKAFKYAYECDKLSAFGGIVALNRLVTAKIAETFMNHFFELVIAPDYEPEALASLKGKKNLRIIKQKKLPGTDKANQKLGSRIKDLGVRDFELKDTVFGMLAQSRADKDISADDLEIVTEEKPTDEQVEELLFAWRAVKWVKSNAIALAEGTPRGNKQEASGESIPRGTHTTGIGAGQMSRVDAVRLAISKAKDKAKGSVLASDAFFPFRDGVDEANKAGIGAIIQPGGSRNDQEVIQACNEHGIPMVFTGHREFRH